MSSLGNPKVALISYDSGVEGFVTSEWVKDKILGLNELGYHVTLVTSAASSLESSENLRVMKVKSLSKNDRLYELGRTGKGSLSLGIVNRVFGRFFDFSFRLLAGSRSDGRWSWALTSLPKLIWLFARNNFDRIVATGGPSAAHLATAAACKITRKRAILEFQDPFIPKIATMSPRAEKVLHQIEAWLVRDCRKFVLVTEEAAKTVKDRHPVHQGKIVGCLPGSPKLVTPSPTERSSEKTPVVFTHLGTLYGTRNLGNLSLAIQRACASKSLKPEEILFQNIGADGSDFLKIYDQIYFENRPAVTRIQGLEIASRSDFLVLVQHTDDRSLDTIPYKTYDYLNLGRPIFGLVRNPELKKIIEDHGGIVADPLDVDEIEEALMQALGKVRLEPSHQIESKINFYSQLEALIEDN